MVVVEESVINAVPVPEARAVAQLLGLIEALAEKMGEKHGSGIRCRGCESAVMVSSRVIVLKNNHNNKTRYTAYDFKPHSNRVQR